jgi:2-C-methyl-D-erythritol 4-phosphate cytidylyltransferase
MNICAIILAGGSGSRMGTELPKQHIEILGKSVLWRTLSVFESCKIINSVVLVSSLDTFECASRESQMFSKVKKVVLGGKTRAESARLGFLAVDFPCDYVAVHDAARCLVSVRDIEAVVSDAIKYGAASASTKITDTVKTAAHDGSILNTVDRNLLRAVQTPQVFSYELYERAILQTDVFSDGISDDNSLMEKIGVKVHLTDTSKNNIKITYKEDLLYAEFLLGREKT